MLSLETATVADFVPLLNQEFELLTGTGGITLTLAAAEARGPGHAARAEPFFLRFHGAPVLRLPQGVYHLQNLTLGPLELFLVQTGADAVASHFEAVFN